jgi:hypothetical protein
MTLTCVENEISQKNSSECAVLESSFFKGFESPVSDQNTRHVAENQPKLPLLRHS